MFNPYVMLGAVLAFLAVGAGGYLKGRADCSAKYEYAAIKSERDNLITAMQAERVAREADAKRMAQNEAQLRELQEKAEQDANDLKDGDSVCFSPDDTDRLRQHFRTAP